MILMFSIKLRCNANQMPMNGLEVYDHLYGTVVTAHDVGVYVG